MSGAVLTLLSLGAGVQSTTLALMAACGEITPMPDAAIFADTMWERQRTYRHLDWLETQLPFPVLRVSVGNIRAGLVARRNSTGGRYAAIPWHMTKPGGEKAMGRRQCSSEYKLTPIMRETRRLLDKPGRAYIAPESVTVMIGISRDEAHPMAPARQRYLRNTWPLIDAGMRRHDCVRWLTVRGFPVPGKSACLGCPFHDNDYWREMRDSDPDEWADACEADAALRSGDARGNAGANYMHRDRVPLAEVDLSVAQADLFGAECMGLCHT